MNPNDISKFIPKAVYHEKRVKLPHIRKGWLSNKETRNKNLRGDDEFQEVPWDEAIEIAAEEISRVKENLVTNQYMEDLMVGLVRENFIMHKHNFKDF